MSESKPEEEIEARRVERKEAKERRRLILKKIDGLEKAVKDLRRSGEAPPKEKPPLNKSESESESKSGSGDRFHVALAPYQCPFVPGGTCYGESCALWIKEVTIKDTGRVEVNRCALYVLAVETLVRGRMKRAGN